MSEEFSAISKRKQDHIKISLKNNVESGLTTGLEKIHFVHRALPDLDYQDIDTSVQLFNKKIHAPILISSMTGGTAEAGIINRRLAEAAELKKIPIAVGSQRAAIENPNLKETFTIRKWAKNIPIFANIGAVQLNYGYSIDACIRVVEMIEADGLILHLNPLQEALQDEGNKNFNGLLKKIEYICKNITVPVIVKEVGWGISKRTAEELSQAGVSAIDVAGAGGTSWSKIEKERSIGNKMAQVADAFDNWGIPTMLSLRMIEELNLNIKVFASGGIRNGVEIAKCIALGADLCGIAGPFLRAAYESTEKIIDLIDIIQEQLRICMFCISAKNINSINKEMIIDY